MPYEFLANAVLSLHTVLVLFVVAGLLLIVARNLLGWRWVNALWFRLLHIGTIGIVVAESWLGIECPLTTLERWLRDQAHATSYEGSFIEHWLQAILFWQAPAWVFTVAYTVFGFAVAAAWWFFPPRFDARRPRRGG